MPVIVQKLIKPVITLSVTQISSTSEDFDHSTTIEGRTDESDTRVSNINKNNIPIFRGVVQVIITTYKDYLRDPSSYDRAEFQGRALVGLDSTGVGPLVGRYAETWYSVGGENPQKGKSYIYKYRDLNDMETDDDPSNIRPSTSNFGDLGFKLSMVGTGIENIILKAKTYYRGNESDVATTYFKIIRTPNREFNHLESLE